MRFSRLNFDRLINLVLVCNFVVLCTLHRDMKSAWKDLLVFTDALFVCFYVAELAIRMAAEGPRHYFRKAWNVLDANVIFISFIAVIVGGKAARACRVLRIIRLLKNVQYFNMISSVMMQSVRQIWHVVCILCVTTFAWAIFGIQIFADVRHGAVIDHNTNFENFPNAVYCLARVMFGEWVYIRK